MINSVYLSHLGLICKDLTLSHLEGVFFFFFFKMLY